MELESLSLCWCCNKKRKEGKELSFCILQRKEVCILEYCSLIGSLHNLSNNKSGNSYSHSKDP